MNAHVPARRVIERRRGGRILLDGVDTIMLGANDYLGLSTDERVLAATNEALRLYGSGTGIYPVFATTPLHEALAENLASFLGVEAVVLFSSGGSANGGVLTTLVGAGDVIISDRLNHASIIDGCRLSRAEVETYENRNIAGLRRALEGTRRAKRRLIVTDGIFSMEGGAAPLPEIQALAREFDALLMIDEAHATGVVGPGGAGTAPLCGLTNGAPDMLLTGSLSKALGGASGGFVAGPRALVEKLKTQSRSWIFTMGMTTANAATALTALKICRNDPGPCERLWRNVAHLREALRFYALACHDSDSAITAVKIGGEERARAMTTRLTRAGVFAPAVSFPIVAQGEARLRLQVSAAHETAELDEAAAALATAFAETG
ncbi:8-amino-7-oxononanoate synthase [Bosea sp. 62]|uniref:aminotransferase class I/II-fold pyridoxal phosphate-dependent enzyme n=1 Tax=unclassified Bosea (in: a-proteobacteria) TaxID=2653178 RepID=UPI001259F421|nr:MULTISPECIES: aminotransferase class I/II-fold pyridoxal phosphate-dependent enzyme [unclassified Bosea (in: a-proteobacteria)]CAD5255178.1 8-amino-7-oxononanoate synthase [Bosea sp. 7B]CAD5275686.1 8-amino-7-oxononanoate synthase [Bosea sp. 21B]CAD5276745.1 8-amino-7-oxononanoate synthase [Bosea sp. 46]VVT59967.1 8-amino-7-oxononanoate synthase [Bosea sp. EC-HK365B]VXB49968.1 8-amino-7-oxononanoate synthase [Bosea sp. 62]